MSITHVVRIWPSSITACARLQSVRHQSAKEISAVCKAAFYIPVGNFRNKGSNLLPCRSYRHIARVHPSIVGTRIDELRRAPFLYNSTSSFTSKSVDDKLGGDTNTFDDSSAAPYLDNPLNKVITAPEIQKILRRYGLDVPVRDVALYKRAFIHRSVEEDSPASSLGIRSNETLEFIGDAVLSSITAMHLFKRFPDKGEGFLTDKKSALVRNEAIGRLSLEIGLQEWFILSKNTEENKTRSNVKKLGCLFEAFVGAIFLDFNEVKVNDERKWFETVFSTGPGFQAAQVFIENVFKEHVDLNQVVKSDDNYKHILQKLTIKEFKVNPVYLELSPASVHSGFSIGVYLSIGYPAHQKLLSQDARVFSDFGSLSAIKQYLLREERVLILLGVGLMKESKRKAEQQACKSALENITATTI